MGWVPPIIHGTGFILNLINRILTFFLLSIQNTCVHSHIESPGILLVKRTRHCKTILLNLLITKACPAAGLTVKARFPCHTLHLHPFSPPPAKSFPPKIIILKFTKFASADDYSDEINWLLRSAISFFCRMLCTAHHFFPPAFTSYIQSRCLTWHTSVDLFMFHQGHAGKHNILPQRTMDT